MKTTVTILLLLGSFIIMAQDAELINDIEKNSGNPVSPVFTSTYVKSAVEYRGSVSEWRHPTTAISNFISGSLMNYYTLLFPEKITSIYEDDNNPGTYNLGTTNNHSVGFVFSPNSEIQEFSGYTKLTAEQPYQLDSFCIDYNYMRFTDNNIPDTLIINIFSPQDILYYNNDKVPRGGTVKYDSIQNKGRDFSHEIKYLLTEKDEIVYDTDGKGRLCFGLSNFDVSPSSYGIPVAITWSFKPGYSYNKTDTLNGDFNQNVPHSNINHFFFWNLHDNSDYFIEEYNNGMFCFSWTNEERYKIEGNYGPVYWRGSSYVDKIYYPVALFKITYDPADGIHEKAPKQNCYLYPNPGKGKTQLKLNLNSNTDINILIYNSQGKLVKEESRQNIPTGESILTVDTKDLQKGFYIVKIIAGVHEYLLNFTKLQ